jgi:hypothetical protein
MLDGLGASIHFTQSPPFPSPSNEAILSSSAYRQHPEFLHASESLPAPLMPSGKREAMACYVVGANMWPGASPPLGRLRVVFYWDGFLDPDDGETMSRFFCERWVEVVERAIDKSNRDLVLDVAVTERLSRKGKIEVALALTNVSGRTLLVPDTLGDGIGALMRVQGFSEHGLYGPIYHPFFQAPYRASCSPLGPGGRREGRVTLDAWRLFLWTGRIPIVFHWDWLPDPDDRGRVARFTAGERWIEVVE